MSLKDWTYIRINILPWTNKFNSQGIVISYHVNQFGII